VDVHDSWQAFLEFWQQQEGPKQLVGYSKFARQHYASDGLYPRGTATWLMFGAETTGLPPEAHDAATHMVKIPMSEQHVRSLNLATSAGKPACLFLRCIVPGASHVGWSLHTRITHSWQPIRGVCPAGIGVMEVLRQKDGAVLPGDA
jgi:hypothetical protein